ncbi:hypothetical protein [Actinoplanes subglobosus]|uniref:ASCH domain-containing protein n=1 Tax=Actinoplanes subglobosus TaxID=1547892 RepID=A0ABV8IGT1_9ACTN
MSILTDYFAAAGDDVAARAADYEEGLISLSPEDVAAGKELYRTDPEQARIPRVKVARTGLLLLQGNNLFPDAPMTWLEVFLTGRTFGEVAADPRAGNPVTATDLEAIVVTVTDTLRDALAGLDADAIRKTAQRWATIEEFQGADPSGLEPWLTAFADLAARAVGRSEHLYCRIVV